MDGLHARGIEHGEQPHYPSDGRALNGRFEAHKQNIGGKDAQGGGHAGAGPEREGGADHGRGGADYGHIGAGYSTQVGEPGGDIQVTLGGILQRGIAEYHAGDKALAGRTDGIEYQRAEILGHLGRPAGQAFGLSGCLLYTSDAADE